MAFGAADRKRLEELVRYCTRPPLAYERLTKQADGRYLLRLKTRWRGGTTYLLFEPTELMERLAAQIPKPRVNLVWWAIVARSATGYSRIGCERLQLAACLPTVGNFVQSPPEHPGAFVRRSVLDPAGMSVTAAAKAAGVGRPAMSNLLNGNVSTTPEIALRLEKAFAVSKQSLLDMQAAFDGAFLASSAVSTKSTSHIPPFLGFLANDIQKWADENIAARSRLAVFLRTLVNSSAVDLLAVDFPGNDDSQLPGADGCVEPARGNAWVPEGHSVWEFGVTAEVKGKADSDYAKTVGAYAKSARATTTFVFVTTRRWLGKSDWLHKVRAKRQWKDVRAYDSCDLEQWLAQSLAGPMPMT